MIIGAHVSTAGGLVKAVERAAGLGCNGMQIFTGSPRVWKSRIFDDKELDEFVEERGKHGIMAVVVHATYLINLASDKKELVEKSIQALVDDMKWMAKMDPPSSFDKLRSVGGHSGVVVHLGSHQGRGFEAMKNQMVEAIKQILDETPDESLFLMENSAGQKGKIASRLEEIKELLDAVGSERLGWCLDTCHSHAAGYRLGRVQDFRIKNQDKETQKGLFDESKEALLLVEEIERLGLWETLGCVHVNDSRDEFGSGRDRHENLGKGKIAEVDMKEFLHHEKIRSLPLILEVPGFDGKGPDKKNVDILKHWAGHKG